MTTSPSWEAQEAKLDPEPNAWAIGSVGQANMNETMQTPQGYEKGRNLCRELLDHPLDPEVRIQLRLWAAELDDMAAATECGAEASARKEFARPL